MGLKPIGVYGEDGIRNFLRLLAAGRYKYLSLRKNLYLNMTEEKLS